MAKLSKDIILLNPFYGEILDWIMASSSGKTEKGTPIECAWFKNTCTKEK